MGETGRVAPNPLAVSRAGSTRASATRYCRTAAARAYLARFHEAAGSLDGHREEHFSTVLAAIAAGRAEILRLHREGSIHDSVLQALEDELDLEEMSARRHLAGG